MLERLVKTYRRWHEMFPHLTKQSRYTLGLKIDAAFLETIEQTFAATGSEKERRASHLAVALRKLDMVKFLLRLAWETKALDNKKYIFISELLNEIGKMLGGWHRKLLSETPARYAGEAR